MPRPQPRYQPNDRIGGRYQVHQALMGGMGEVYLCLDLEEMLPYALKTFQQRYQSQALRKAFEQEVGTWVALERHPNIVRCFYMDTLDNQPFMVLEWIAGEEGKGADLRGWLRRGPLDLRIALEITLDVVRGLMHAQTKQPGLVHRDLKPENILVAQGGLAKITDFGLAQIVASAGLEFPPVPDSESPSGHRTATISIQNPKSKIQNPIAGTPAYMAPEQWRGELLDERTDIYAVGCILYELLTGQRLFRVGFNPTTPQQFQQWLGEMQSRHENNLPPPLPDHIPIAVSELVVGCLAKTSTQRPHNLTEMLGQLEQTYYEQFAAQPRVRPPAEQFTSTDYTNRGNTYHKLRRYDEALADHKRAIDLDPTLALARTNRNVTYQTLRRYDEALADYKQAIDLDPTDAQAYTNRGVTYQTLQRYDEALADHKRAIDLDPTLALARTNRGATYADLRRYDEALADYERAIDLDPTYPNVYYNRGLVYHRLRRYDDALADYKQAIDLDPTDAQAYSARGVTYADLRRYDDALADYKQAIDLDPTNALTHTRRGIIYTDLQDYDEALANHRRAIDLDPTLALAYSNRGVTYEALERYKEALADYGRAIALDPNDALAYSNRGNTYHSLQQYEAALADCGRTIVLDPSDALAYARIGLLMAMQGKIDEALPYLDKAHQIGDDQAKQMVVQIRQALGLSSTPQPDPDQAAFEAFQRAASSQAMRQAVAQYPFITQPNFIAAIEQTIAQQVPPEQQPHFEERLAWLKQIAQEQNR